MEIGHHLCRFLESATSHAALSSTGLSSACKWPCVRLASSRRQSHPPKCQPTVPQGTHVEGRLARRLPSRKESDAGKVLSVVFAPRVA
eukprot:2371909-Pyramimonas_sp.AAC.2